MSERDRIKTVDDSPEAQGPISLYAKRKRIQVKSISGRFQRIRDFTILSTMGLYLALPWVRWDGQQAVLFDLPNRQFHIFGLTLWPQDFLFLSWTLIIAAFALFFFTVLAGRVYCGYVCPQTTWTRFFQWIEQLFEGDRHSRIKMDEAPWTLSKVLRRGSKHVMWLALAFLTGLTFVGYFSPITDLTVRIFNFSWGGWELFWVAFFTVATYMNAGFMREQVCLYMCPYARFQSVMFDRETLIVSYDEARGEPRGRGSKKRQQGTQEVEKGDCIDCGLCVQVCPTGIDIRDGLQYECITCAACIDACDDVMDHIDKPRGLIRYTTENALEGKESRVIRPRLVGYGMVLLAMATLFMVTLYNRVPLQVDVLRDRNQLFRVASSGRVENVYRLEILNKGQDAHRYTLTLEGPEGLRMENSTEFTIQPGQHLSLPVTVSYDPYEVEMPSSTIWFSVRSLDDPDLEKQHESRFITPRG
ncbi:MAG: cytochrome c oxidase accessory protein CcoG [Pseudomonadota bacterium]|uniref:cytochrome c oxidase accessory protein CcoG n=1 Tax=Alcanivorax sp. NBRC 102024 TaxID=1113895 RepID=UPI000789DD9F|nr:cytochrome c oxidase accessory protein CcoG [Alcanivorax sp. NBRC 102024]MEE2603387.1 cytochrome c oxidase accessory protein CcoG [Pseudomonadota bacterium]